MYNLQYMSMCLFFFFSFPKNWFVKRQIRTSKGITSLIATFSQSKKKAKTFLNLYYRCFYDRLLPATRFQKKISGNAKLFPPLEFLKKKIFPRHRFEHTTQAITKCNRIKESLRHFCILRNFYMKIFCFH